MAQTYYFGGTPQQINAAAMAHAVDRTATAKVNEAFQNARGQAAAAAYNQAGQFAGAMGQAGAGRSHGIGMLGGAMGDIGRAYGSVGQAIGNERSNFYGANAMAEAARQAGMASLGTGAMAAYGGAANNALQAQAMQSTAYMKALSDMQAANQGSVGGMGRAQVVAGAMPGLGGGSGGFMASGPGGPIASGSYSGGMTYGGGNASAGNRALDTLTTGDQAYREQLERGFNSQAGAPRSMLADALAGVQGLYGSGARDMRGGMNQFYAVQADPRNRGDYSGVLGGLASMGNQIGGLADRFGTGGVSAISSLWDKSIGRLSDFQPKKRR